MLRVGRPAEAVLLSCRRFPSLEPISLHAVSSKVLGLPTRRDILWQAVVYERDAERVGSKVIVGRQDMGYSRRKLRPQKGSGRALMGDRGNPIRHDGGRAFGRPAPGDMSTGLPSSLYSLAIRTALSLRYRDGHLYIVNRAELPDGHELVGREWAKLHHVENQSVTFVVDQHRPNLFDATSAQWRIDVVPKEMVTVQDILRPTRLIIEKSAFDFLAAQFCPPQPIQARRPNKLANASAGETQVDASLPSAAASIV